MISAKVIKHSITTFSEEIATLKLVFPRFILSELNTHRVFTKNSASSRAIPFPKMVKTVKENTFIPIAYQKNHSGMQGTEYLSKTVKYGLTTFIGTLIDTLQTFPKYSKDYDVLKAEVDEKVAMIETILLPYKFQEKTLDEWWLFARDKAIEAACIMYCFGVTKQLCNRLLEPFMWHSVILTSTEFENFFKQRCPKYALFSENIPIEFRSKKDLLRYVKQVEALEFKDSYDNLTQLEWLEINKGQAEIHMMALAEAMWDALNESTPQLLQPGEWHIPYDDKIDDKELEKITNFKPLNSDGAYQSAHDYNLKTTIENCNNMNYNRIKVSTAMCARESYTTIGDEKEFTIEKQIALHDKLINSDPKHWSPTEHCSKAMTAVERMKFLVTYEDSKGNYSIKYGVCRNYTGFIQYRHLLDTGV